MNHILINSTHKEEIRVAIVKDQKLTGLDIETSLNRKTKGICLLVEGPTPVDVNYLPRQVIRVC